MGSVYSPEHKMLAKSLAVATGNRRLTEKLLGEAWPDGPPVPSQRALAYWKADPAIPVDEQIVATFADKARATILAVSERLATKMGSTVEEANRRYLENQGNALDILNVTKSFGILADKLNGRFGNQPGVMNGGGLQINGGNVQIVAWAPKELPPPREVELIDQPAGD